MNNDQKLLKGEEAQKVLGEILESERKSRSLTFPAHTGAQGYFRDGAKYVAFDNSSNDCWVEEFKNKENAKAWLRGEISAEDSYQREKPVGLMDDIILTKDSFKDLMYPYGSEVVRDLPPNLHFDEDGELFIRMEFHDGFAYDTNPHGYGFFDRVALYYPTMEEVKREPSMIKAIQDYTGRVEVTPYDVALKFGQASRMRCPDYRYNSAKRAVVERVIDPSAIAFTESQRKAIELAADCGGFWNRPRGKDFFYDALFCNSERVMGDVPRAWKADVTAELRELAQGKVRGESRGLHL